MLWGRIQIDGGIDPQQEHLGRYIFRTTYTSLQILASEGPGVRGRLGQSDLG